MTAGIHLELEVGTQLGEARRNFPEVHEGENRAGGLDPKALR